jgi:hypothetical protein
MTAGKEVDWRRWRIIGVIVVVVLIAIAIDENTNGGGDAPSIGDSYGAQFACEQFVEDRLKSPGTAEFTDQTETNDGVEWTSIGSVDSQNTFGGVVRNDYVCVVQYEGGEDESYSLVSISGLQN